MPGIEAVREGRPSLAMVRVVDYQTNKISAQLGGVVILLGEPVEVLIEAHSWVINIISSKTSINLSRRVECDEFHNLVGELRWEPGYEDSLLIQSLGKPGGGTLQVWYFMKKQFEGVREFEITPDITLSRDEVALMKLAQQGVEGGPCGALALLIDLLVDLNQLPQREESR